MQKKNLQRPGPPKVSQEAPEPKSKWPGAKVLMAGAEVLMARANVILARVGFARAGVRPKVKPSGNFSRF